MAHIEEKASLLTETGATKYNSTGDVEAGAPLRAAKTAPPKEEGSTSCKLWSAMGFCFLFMLAEAAGGYISGSIAILTDALHLMSDIASFLLSIFAIHLAKRGASSTMTFGYKRISLLGALGSVAITYALTGVLVWEAIQRLTHMKENHVNGKLMTIIAVAGLVVNLSMLLILGHSHGHGGDGGGHGHSHGAPSPPKKKTKTKTKKEPAAVMDHDHAHGHDHGHGHGHEGCDHAEHAHGDHCNHDDHAAHDDCDDHSGHDHGGHGAHEVEDLNVTAAYCHAIGDLIQSLFVLAAGVTIWLKPSLQIVDPICTLISACLVLSTTFGVLLSATRVFMGGVPAHCDPAKLRASLAAISGVVSVHDLHLWELVPGEPLASVHIVIDAAHSGATEWSVVLAQCNSTLADCGFAHSTVQIESENAACQHSCN